MKSILIAGLIFLAAVATFQLNSDFASFDAKRGNYVKVSDPSNSYIGYSCGNSVVLSSGGCCCESACSCDGNSNHNSHNSHCSSTGLAEYTVLEISNNMLQPVNVEILQTVWSGGKPAGLEFEIVNDHFSLMPGEVGVVTAMIGDDGVSAGVYYATFEILVTWENGSAFIITTPCPFQLEVTGSYGISAVLVSGNISVSTHTEEMWEYMIVVEGGADSNCTIVVKDVVPGEFEILSITASTGSYVTWQTGKATHYEWTFTPSGYDTLTVSIRTKLNPAGKQEFTSPGYYDLDDGAEIKGCGLSANKLTVQAHDS
jgi:hypothetical protein